VSIVHERYLKLKPELRYLCDEAVLAQAWKKSHSYIRAHNWYADTLELDCSAVNLEERLKEWAEQLNTQTYSPSEMMMVPAPKSDHWTFYKTNEEWKWGPKNSNEDKSRCKELRPLAHLTIQDQTIATAIMLCLADAVETAQGSTDPQKGHNVWSYGNRLFCDWKGTQARFRWGNSNTYSKYFQDYQRFLDRPLKKAQAAQAALPPTNSIYEIHLDLATFFDSINRRHLIRKLKLIAESHYDSEPESSALFWETVADIFENWKWRDEDKDLAFCLKRGNLCDGEGLPQGLVASGFFANAYLISLDRKLSKQIGKQFGDVTLIDYCRYVDDIRLLVHVPIKDEPQWENWVDDEIAPIVELVSGLSLNSKKTKVERYTAKRSGVSVRMKAIQSAGSGPQDMMALDEMQGSLEGLFALAEQFRGQDDVPHRDCDIPLARVDQPQMDVGEDTLLRFAANRITTALSKKRSFASSQITNIENVSELDHVYESFARRFVAVWTRNPSLVAILKKGIQLYPHPHLLQPVFDSLSKKMGPSKNDPGHEHDHGHEYLIAAYCLAEIYRFAALDLHRQNPKERPQHSDWEGLKNFLIHRARLLLDDDNLPWYVGQQIALYMAVNEEPVKLSEGGELVDSKKLFRILQGDRRFGVMRALESVVPLYVVAYQISSRPHQIIANLSDWIDWLYKEKKRPLAAKVLKAVAINHSELFERLLCHGRKIQAKWKATGATVAVKLGLDQTPLIGNLSEFKDYIPLARVIKREDNPFSHENALLDLARATLKFLGEQNDTKQLAPHHLEIKCNNWSKIQKAKESVQRLELRWVKSASADSRYSPPVSWLANNNESKKLYKIGAFLRACSTGELDFTVGQHLKCDETNHAYFGLKSSWYKRRMGMAHQPEALIGPAAPLTSWVSELLYRLLQWPGLEIRDNDEWPEKLSVVNLQKLLLDRIGRQEEVYGRSSRLPVYIERIRHKINDDNHLRIVMAQSILPNKEDFRTQGSELNNPIYRAKHGGHVATIARLICDKLAAAKQAEGSESIKPLADLIVFPELAVHEDDIWILKRLADKTGAMIFTGLVYRKQGPDLVNSALWLIPYENGHGRQWIMRYQGKENMTVGERGLNIKPWRPYQLVIELINTLEGQKHGFRLSGSICYDATDISLAADMKDVTNTFIVSALNRDIDTFDTMVDALHYHMFQPVILVNSGQFGGSAAKAPYKEKYEKQIAHAHGNNQIAISMFKLNMYDFGEPLPALVSGKEKKTAPAGLKRTKSH
jgi:hypothetical protein